MRLTSLLLTVVILSHVVVVLLMGSCIIPFDKKWQLKRHWSSDDRLKIEEK